MLTIMEMLGVPTADQPAVARAAEKLFGLSDDEYSSLEERAKDTVNEIMLLSHTGAELAKFRRNHPADDLMTSTVNAEVDGPVEAAMARPPPVSSSVTTSPARRSVAHRWSLILPLLPCEALLRAFLCLDTACLRYLYGLSYS